MNFFDSWVARYPSHPSFAPYSASISVENEFLLPHLNEMRPNEPSL